MGEREKPLEKQKIDFIPCWFLLGMKYTHMSDGLQLVRSFSAIVLELVKLWRHNENDDYVNNDGEEATHQKSNYVCEGGDWHCNSCAEVIMYLYLYFWHTNTKLKLANKMSQLRSSWFIPQLGRHNKETTIHFVGGKTFMPSMVFLLPIYSILIVILVISHHQMIHIIFIESSMLETK